MLLTYLFRYDKSGTMEIGEDRMVDMYENFCQGTHTDPIDRPKAAIFLFAAFGIGFATANIPQWWHRLLPPQARCILGQEGYESPTPPATVARVTNSARARSRADAQHQAFWDTIPRPILDSFGGGGSADVPQSRAPVTASVTTLDCVSVLNALQGSELTRAEKRAREAAVSRLCLILAVPARQRQRDESDESD